MAALTTWALVVPQAIAYAQIAQLPPQAGLFAAFAGLLGYALAGSSRQLVVSPTSATAAISAALVAPVAMGDATRFGELSAALAILVGIVLVVLGVLHVGFVSRFISASVQAGFMFGLGLTIIVGQVPALLGVSKGEGDFFPQLGHLLTRLGDVDGWTAAVGLGCLALLLALKRVARAPRRPCWRWWPASSWSPWATWPTTAWTSSARLRGPCPCRRSPRWAGTSCWRCCRARWRSPSSATPRPPPWASPWPTGTATTFSRTGS